MVQFTQKELILQIQKETIAWFLWIQAAEQLDPAVLCRSCYTCHYTALQRTNTNEDNTPVSRFVSDKS